MKVKKAKSSVNDADLLTMFLESPETFTDDDIVDELIQFFFAALRTTQFAS